MKVMTVVGTRPEVIRLSRVMPALDRSLEHVIAHTGQHYDYELNQVFFDDLELRRPDHFLGAAGATPCATVGAIIAGVDQLLAKEQPNALLILGDTNSCLAAYPAKRRKIPVFHMEAGNRCFDERVPEEINRRLVDHISDINLPYSDIARAYLLAEGLPPDRVIKTGSPLYEVLAHYRPKIERSSVLERLGLAPGEFFLVSAHRDETLDDPVQLRKLVEVLNQLACTYGLPVLVSTHPRARRALEHSECALDGRVQLHKPWALTDYIRLQQSARAVLSDSGSITEESSILGFPALNLREAHERPEGFEEGTVMLVGLDWARVRVALDVLSRQPRSGPGALRMVADYSVPNVSEKIVRIVVSYTGYVRRVVWRRPD